MDSWSLLTIFALLLVFAASTITTDSSYGEVLSGDGKILEMEIVLPENVAGFVDDETITIIQDANESFGIFQDLNPGLIDQEQDELLSITTQGAGFASQNIIITDGNNTALGEWVDIDNDQMVESHEITISSSDSFPNGPVEIKNEFGTLTLATASFEDFPIMEDGEIMITDGGSGFVDGTITISGDISATNVDAEFVDLPVCPISNSGDWASTFNCTVSSNAIAPANVMVQNGSWIIIIDGATLDIDFVNFNLTIKSGSGVLIKSGGAII
jgi:hypothetical protein